MCRWGREVCVDDQPLVEELRERVDRLSNGIRKLGDARDRHIWAVEQGHDNEPELGSRVVRALDELVALLDVAEDDRENGQ